jgi:Fe-S-cluster containining protein
MNIVQKARAVEELFKTLQKDIEKLQLYTGINCIENCIKCCTTSKIEATALEFYPLALQLYRTGQAENFLAKIERVNDPAICSVLNYLAHDGKMAGCEYYEYRGLVCRLFGFNYTTNKYCIKSISTCKCIKLKQPESVFLANKILLHEVLGPNASNYYSRLQFIDFTESQQLYPISEAIRRAIEAVISYFYYSGKTAI